MVDRAKEIISQYESSDLHLTVDEYPGVVVVHLNGDLVGGASEQIFREKMRELAGKPGLKKIILDMAGIRFLNSSGVGSLVSAFTNAKSSGIDLQLASLPKKLYDLLQITKLYTVFLVSNSVEEALGKPL